METKMSQMKQYKCIIKQKRNNVNKYGVIMQYYGEGNKNDDDSQHADVNGEYVCMQSALNRE